MGGGGGGAAHGPMGNVVQKGGSGSPPLGALGNVVLKAWLTFQTTWPECGLWGRRLPRFISRLYHFP